MASDSRRADHVAVTSDGVTVARGVLCVEAASVAPLTLAMTFPHRFGATLFPAAAGAVAAGSEDAVVCAQ